MIDDYINLISKCNKLIFSNYNNFDICIRTDNKYNEKQYINYIYSQFNQLLKLPKNLTHLTFGYKFVQQIVLPENLTHLIIGYKFNQVVQLSYNIKYLGLDNNNNNIIDYLHDTIEELILGKYFNSELNNLPCSINSIVLKNENYNKKLNCLPNNIELIALPKYYNLKIEKIPDKLKKLKCSINYNFKNDFSNIEIEYYWKIDFYI